MPGEHTDRSTEWAELRARYLRPSADRPETAGGGVHHVALFCSDIEQTIVFYQDLLGFPFTCLIENRDYRGSSHLFFDIGNGNALAFFDFPGLDLGPYAEVLAGLHHLAISVTPGRWSEIRSNLTDAGIETHEESGKSLYFSGPDGERLEILCEPLGEMYGETVI